VANSAEKTTHLLNMAGMRKPNIGNTTDDNHTPPVNLPTTFPGQRTRVPLRHLPPNHPNSRTVGLRRSGFSQSTISSTQKARTSESNLKTSSNNPGRNTNKKTSNRNHAVMK
jgi:hypothetical protein